MKFLRLAVIMISVLLPLGAVAAGEGATLRVQGDASVWWLLDEQVENATLQSGSGDEAADSASGFDFRQGRIAFIALSPDHKMETLIRLRLEERTDIIDFYGAYHFNAPLNFYVGQMKIPSTAEVLRPDNNLDFVTRSSFGQVIGDYALSRTPYISSLMAVRSLSRDLGLALKGSYPDAAGPGLTWFLMVSNGIGAGNYVGGNESPEFLHTNEFGDYFYGLRVEGRPVDGLLIGGHYSINTHDNVMLQDKTTVVDFEREAWSADAEYRFPFGLRLYGFYGKGRMDDFLNSQHYDFDYSGWGVQAVQALFNGQLELAGRYDTLEREFMRDGNVIEQNDWTAGVNWRPNPFFRLQANYIWKDTVDETMTDLNDDLIVLNFQYLFDVGMAVKTPG
jgi:hypothetical protein